MISLRRIYIESAPWSHCRRPMCHRDLIRSTLSLTTHGPLRQQYGDYVTIGTRRDCWWTRPAPQGQSERQYSKKRWPNYVIPSGKLYIILNGSNSLSLVKYFVVHDWYVLSKIFKKLMEHKYFCMTQSIVWNEIYNLIQAKHIMTMFCNSDKELHGIYMTYAYLVSYQIRPHQDNEIITRK